MGEWKKYKIEDVCNTISDTYKGGAESVVLINTSDVLEGKCLNHTWQPNENLKGQFKKTFMRNDILYSEIRPANKRFAYVDFDAENYIASTKLMVLRHNDKILPKYLYYILKSQRIIDELQLLAETRSGTFPQITFSELSRLEILLPDLAQQKQIIDFAESLDDKIELNRRINANLELQAQTLFNHWFVDFEFPNADGKPYKSSGGKLIYSPLGPIPEGWKVGNLGDLVKPRKGKNITRSQVKDGDIPVIAGGLTPSCFHCESNTLAPVITVSASGANAGFVQLHHTPVWASDSSYIDSTLTKYVYFIYVFLSIKQHVIYHKQQGCAQPHIYPSDLAELDMIVPNMVEIERFEKMCQPIFETVGLNIRENIRLSQLRDTLLPKLIRN